MKINMEHIRTVTWKRYQEAKENLMPLKENAEGFCRDAISDVIPGFSAEKLEFGSYDKENYAVLFVDMRNSTHRAQKIGAEKTFLTMHIFLTALLETVVCYHGKVIDIMGDGLMVFWGGKAARAKEAMTKTRAVQNAGLCGRDMLKVCGEIINPMVEQEGLGPPIRIGVGVAFGSVIVTKIGVAGTYDVKAFGGCINTASKYAQDTSDNVKVSNEVKNIWPSGENGKISFTSDGDGYILEQDV